MKKVIAFVMALCLCCMPVCAESTGTHVGDTTTNTTNTSKKTTTKKTTMSKKSSKTSTKKSTSTKTSYQNSLSSDKVTEIHKKIVVKTTVKTYRTKGSKTKKVTTTVVKTTYTTTTRHYKGTIGIDTLAPRAHENVRYAVKKLGFVVKADPAVSYTGYFSATGHSITVQHTNTAIYHELGHFVSFVSGNTDKTAEFKNIYAAEKDNYVGSMKPYVTKDSSEYFAESYSDYILHNADLKTKRPRTYNAIQSAINKITNEQITKVYNAYFMFWN